MTKSQRSATKLRLSRLVRTLASLCLIKITLLGLLLLDLPLTGADEQHHQAGPIRLAQAPATSEAPNQGRAAPDSPTVLPAAVGDTQDSRPQREPEMPAAGDHPQGNEAAKLAAMALPRRPQAVDGQFSKLPVPLLPAMDLGNSPNRRDPESNPAALPLPRPLNGSLPAAREQAKGTDAQEGGFLDLLSLKSLPIPAFGGLQAAHAASLDMPVPPTPAPASPFTPAEQIAPLSNSPRVIPGAPPLPANIPHGQMANGSPIPQGSGISLATPPAPHVNPVAPLDNPDFKANEIARQQQDILMLRQQMDQRLKDLQSAEKKMKEMIQEARALEDQKVRNLVQMYANMKPRTAAQALENMDERVAVRILAGMAPKQSGEILTYTDPAKTAKFTELLTRMRMAQ